MKRVFIFLLLSTIKMNVLFSQNSFYFGMTEIKELSQSLDGSVFVSGNFGNTSSLIKTNMNQLDWAEYFGNGYEIQDILAINNDAIILNKFFDNNLNLHTISKIESDGQIAWTKSSSFSSSQIGILSNNFGNINGQPVFAYLKVTSEYELFILDTSGNELWSRKITLVGDNPKMTFDIDGNLVLSFSRHGKLFLVKLDSIGDLSWFKEYIFTFMDNFSLRNIVTLPNKAIVVFGDMPYYQTKMFYFNQNGNCQISKEFSAYGVLELNSSIEFDSSLIFTFNQFPIDAINDPNPNYSGVLKLDFNLNILNQITFPYTYALPTITAYDQNFLMSYSDHFFRFNSSLNVYCDTIANTIFSSTGLMPFNVINHSQVSGGGNLNSNSMTKTNFSESISEGCITLNLAIFNSEIDFSIYPNPSSSQFTLSYSGEEKNLQYTIHDILGKEIISGRINSSTTQIDCSKWSRGVYLVKFGNQNGYSVKKVVIE